MGPLEGRLPDFDKGGKRPKLLGAYRVWLTYGGPQEGGWWVPQYQHVASLVVRKGDRLPQLARQLWDMYEAEDDGRRVSDSNADCAIVVLREDKPGHHESLGIPAYE
jgi:hypothetical protein